MVQIIAVAIVLKASILLDPIDRRLLEKAQNEFPLTVRPWASMGKDLGITEREVLERLSRLARRGVIRKIGPALDAGHVGLRASSLIAMKVPENRIENVANAIGKYGAVSHCHQRDHEYNLWFTLTAHDETELEEIVKEVRRGAGIAEEDVLNLPSIRIFKIDVRFQLR